MTLTKRPLSFLSGALVVAFTFAFPLTAAADIETGQEASAVLGQTVDGSTTLQSFTQSGTNNGPNSWGFSQPSSLAIDSVGHRLFVSDRTNNRVLVFNLASDNSLTDFQADSVLGQPDFSSREAALTQSGLNEPLGLAYDSLHQRLFVASSEQDRVLVFDVATITNGESAVNVLGQPNFTSSTSATTQAGMSLPISLAYDTAGDRLFVSDSLNRRVLVFDVASITNGENAVNVLGQPDFTSKTSATTQNGMNIPSDLLFDATRLFVCDRFNNRVLVYDLTDIFDGENAVNVLGQADFTSEDSGVSQSRMMFPSGLGYDAANTRLFVSDALNNRVLVFDVAAITDGENAINVLGQTDFVTNSSVPSQSHLGSPLGLAYVGGTNRLFVSDVSYNRVVGFDVAAIQDGENAVDLLGQYRDFSAANPDFTASRPNSGTKSIGFDDPRGVALDADGHRLFVADPENNRVLMFNLTEDNSIDDLQADAVLGQADLNSSVIGLPTPASLYQPVALAYDTNNDRLFVSDRLHSRVLVFDVASITNGENAVNVLGKPDFTSQGGVSSQSNIAGPDGLAYDSTNDRLFVCSDNRVLVFDTTTITDGESAVNVLGQPDFTSTTSATTQSGMENVVDVAYDDINGRLFVSDSGNNARVLVFDVETITDGEAAINVLGQLDFTSGGIGNATQHQFSSPNGLAYDPITARLFVSDIGNSRVMVFDTADIANGENAIYVLGQVNFTASDSAVTRNGLNSPHGLYYDMTAGRLMVADSGNHRVVSFDFNLPPPTPTPVPPTATPTATPSPTTPTKGEVKQGIRQLKKIKGNPTDNEEIIEALEELLFNLTFAASSDAFTKTERKKVKRAASLLNKMLDTSEAARNSSSKKQKRRLRTKVKSIKEKTKAALEDVRKVI